MSLSANASSPIPASSAPLLQAEGVTVRFDACERPFDVVRDVSFTLHPGRTLCLVGESGCGKSMTALSLLRLIPEPGRLAAGRILFEGRDLAELSESAMERVRGRDIGMIFQDPMTSLNPLFTRSPKPWNCSGWSAYPRRTCASATTRTSFPAVCASAS